MSTREMGRGPNAPHLVYGELIEPGGDMLTRDT